MRGKKTNKKAINIIDILIILVAVGVTTITLVSKYGDLTGELLVSTIILLLNAFYIIFCAKGFRFGYLFAIVNSLAAAYVALLNNFLGNAGVNMFFYFPAAIIAFFSWGKNQRKDSTVKVRRLSPMGRLLVGLSAVVMFLLLSFLIRGFGGDIAFADGFVAVCGVFATILAILRYHEQWIFNFCAELVLLGIWAYAGNLCMFTSRAIRLVGDIYGYINWRKLLVKKKLPRKLN